MDSEALDIEMLKRVENHFAEHPEDWPKMLKGNFAISWAIDHLENATTERALRETVLRMSERISAQETEIKALRATLKAANLHIARLQLSLA